MEDKDPGKTELNLEPNDSKWEGRKEQQKAEEKWGNKVDDAAESSHGNNATQNLEPPAPQHNQDRIPCGTCGLFNHETKDCRRLRCEICGLNSNTAYDCKMCLSWNYGPKLCASQVEDQIFFYIEEDIDPRMVREKESVL